MSYLGSSTAMTTSRTTSLTSSTDVVVGAGYYNYGDYASWYAWTTCTKKVSNTSCDRHDIIINTKNPHSNYRSVMCHEIGHSIGMGHAPAKNSYFTVASGRRSCMRGSPDVVSYSAGDRYRINALYG